MQAAVGAEVGLATLSISDRTPTVTTLAAGWREARSREAGFGGVRWNRRIEVETMTLDAADRAVRRAGLRQDRRRRRGAGGPGRTDARCAGVVIRICARCIDEVRACLERLGVLGRYVFNWSSGESFRLASSEWLSAEALIASLETAHGRQRSGDVYARVERP